MLGRRQVGEHEASLPYFSHPAPILLPQGVAVCLQSLYLSVQHCMMPTRDLSMLYGGVRGGINQIYAGVMIGGIGDY